MLLQAINIFAIMIRAFMQIVDASRLNFSYRGAKTAVCGRIFPASPRTQRSVEMGKSNLKEKVSTTWNNVVLHWKTPALGKYVSYKEIIAYGIGGMGVQFVMFFCSLIALSATSFLVGNTIGIKPMHLQYMAVASTIIGFGITIGRSYIIDSARFKSGKFRPWLAITGIPTVIIAVVFVWLPYETMSYMQKVIAVFLCYNLLQCFYPFFQQAYTDLANVISPNSHERTDIVSVSSITTPWRRPSRVCSCRCSRRSRAV